MKPAPIVHLLKPKLYRVWCRPDDLPCFPITSVPSKCTCANCLTRYRRRDGKMGRGRGRFRVAHTGRNLDPNPFAEWKHPDNAHE